MVQEWNKGSDIRWPATRATSDPALPYLDEIHISLNTDENTQVLRLQSGEADGVFEALGISPAGLRLLKRDPSLTVAPSVGPRIYYLALENGGMFANRTCASPSHMPSARDFLAQFGDLAKPWNQLMGSTTVQSDPEGTRIYPYDPEKAKAYLDVGRLRRHAGQGHLRRHRPVSGSANSTALKQDLEAVGFTVDLQGLQSGRVLQRRLRPGRARHLVDLLERRLPRRAGLLLHQLRLRLVPQHLALL